eukprot:Awhi_evm1s1176
MYRTIKRGIPLSRGGLFTHNAHSKFNEQPKATRFLSTNITESELAITSSISSQVSVPYFPEFLEFGVVNCGLPWWGSIMALGVATRIACFPLKFNCNHFRLASLNFTFTLTTPPYPVCINSETYRENTRLPPYEQNNHYY